MPNFGVTVSAQDKDFCNRVVEDFQADRQIKKKGDALVTLLQEYQLKGFSESSKEETQEPEVTPRREYLVDYCNRGLMQIIGGIPVCMQRVLTRGIQGQQPFVYPRGHPMFKETKIITMSDEDIKRTCDGCMQGFSEDKRLKEAIERMNLLLDENREVTLYSCLHPKLIKSVLTAFKDFQLYCPMESRYCTIERTCIPKKCLRLWIQNMQIPPPIIEA